MFGHFLWFEADCVVQLSDGRIKSVNTCLECNAEYDHWYEMHGELGGYEEFWEIFPIEGTVKPLASDEFIIDGKENESDLFITKIIDYEDNYGWNWELAS